MSRSAIFGLLLLAACDRKAATPASTDRANAERQAIAKADADVRAANASAAVAHGRAQERTKRRA